MTGFFLRYYQVVFQYFMQKANNSLIFSMYLVRPQIKNETIIGKAAAKAPEHIAFFKNHYIAAPILN